MPFTDSQGINEIENCTDYLSEACELLYRTGGCAPHLPDRLRHVQVLPADGRITQASSVARLVPRHRQIRVAQRSR